MGGYPELMWTDLGVEFKGEFELTSLVGNISTKNGNPFIHIHVNVSDEECNAYGGHLFSGTITATGELIIFLSDSVVRYEVFVGLCSFLTCVEWLGFVSLWFALVHFFFNIQNGLMGKR